MVEENSNRILPRVSSEKVKTVFRKHKLNVLGWPGNVVAIGPEQENRQSPKVQSQWESAEGPDKNAKHKMPRSEMTREVLLWPSTIECN